MHRGYSADKPMGITGSDVTPSADRLSRLRDRIRSSLLEFHDAFARSGSRSTAVAPLHWLLGLVLSALLTAIGLKADDWVVWLLLVGAGIAFALECAAYIYFVLSGNVDAVRSERYAIDKMRIERGLMGDSASGFKHTSTTTIKELPPALERAGGIE